MNTAPKVKLTTKVKRAWLDQVKDELNARRPIIGNGPGVELARMQRGGGQ